MDSDSWNSSSRFNTSSRRCISRSDLFFGGLDETDVDDELRAEFLCPFCAEDFDVVGLCCHIDEEHPVEVKNGVCPVCAKRVGMDLVPHLTMQHGSLLKVQRKRRLRRGSTFSTLRKELREGNLQSLLGGSCISSSADPDPLLTSFIYHPSTAEESEAVQSLPSITDSVVKEEGSSKSSVERSVQEQKLSDKDQEERARKCEFVQGLLLSTILDDDL